MSREKDRFSEEAARSIWRRAAKLQAEAERRFDEAQKRLPPPESEDLLEDGFRADDIRESGEAAGISPEFVQIALAEAAAAGDTSAALSDQDLRFGRIFLGSARQTIEASRTVEGSVDSVCAAILHVFGGHPLLLQPGEVADLPRGSGRVIVFTVPKYDWGATANPPFVEKAATVGLKQLHIAVRPLDGDADSCEVVVAADLHPGMRSRWRWSAATSAGAGAAGGAVGVSMAVSAAIAGAVLFVPAVVGAAALGGASVGGWVLSYRYALRGIEEAFAENLRLLPAAIWAVRSTRETGPAGSDRSLPGTMDPPNDTAPSDTSRG